MSTATDRNRIRALNIEVQRSAVEPAVRGRLIQARQSDGKANAAHIESSRNSLSKHAIRDCDLKY
jgi:hypothetical protein